MTLLHEHPQDVEDSSPENVTIDTAVLLVLLRCAEDKPEWDSSVDAAIESIPGGLSIDQVREIGNRITSLVFTFRPRGPKARRAELFTLSFIAFSDIELRPHDPRTARSVIEYFKEHNEQPFQDGAMLLEVHAQKGSPESENTLQTS